MGREADLTFAVMWKFTGSLPGGKTAATLMAQADCTPTNILAHLCHLRPASLCPCERTVSSAWLQPLCGGAITGRARPPLAGGGVIQPLRSAYVCCCLRKLWSLLHGELLVSNCASVSACVGLCFLQEIKLLFGYWEKEFPFKGMLGLLGTHS